MMDNSSMVRVSIRRDSGAEAIRQDQKAFIFLYPQPEMFDFELSRGFTYFQNSKKLEATKSEEGMEEYKKYCKSIMNACIDARYRQQGFTIVFALFDSSQISDVLEVHPNDKIVYVGMDAETHKTKKPGGEYPYPNQDKILNQLGQIGTLRVAGFHMWDCVERLARRAYERGLDVLVDEDLTEFFTMRIEDHNFRVDKYPTYNPNEGGESHLEMFMDARRNKPWLWQDYNGKRDKSKIVV